MKNIFKALFAIAASTALFVSCQKAGDDLALAISADKIALEFDGFNPQTMTVNVDADGDWYAYSPEWLTVQPSHGTGKATVTIAASKNVTKYNELDAPRADIVAFCGSGEARAAINVKQIGEPGLDATKHFKIITSNDQFDPSVPYLLVFDINGSLQSCLNIACGKDDNTYAYGYTTATPAPDADGVITVTRPGMSCNFEAVDGSDGYVLRQPNGAYLYQSASYANFYLTADKSKASIWTIDIASDGHATIKNISAGDRILQYDLDGYKDFGAWPEVGKGYILPYLYKDSAEPTGEVLSADEKVFVAAEGTSAKIALEANRKWKVRNHESWVKSFTAEGEGSGDIEITLDPNTGDKTRTASFQIIGETTYIDVTLYQAGVYTSISGLNEWLETAGTSVDFAANLKDATVSYVNGSNAFIEDKEAGILLYQNGHGLKVGDSFTGKITGKGTMYGGAPELTKWDASEATKTTGVDAPCTEVALGKLISDFSKYVSRVVLVKGVKFTDGLYSGDRNGKVEKDDKNIAVYAKVSSGIVIPTGSEGDLKAIPCYNGTTKQLGIWENGQFTATLIGGSIEMPSALEIELGSEAVALGAKINSGADITYKSSDATVATVDAEGNVTALKIGEATITATAPAVAGVDGAPGYSAAEATCKVTVAAPAPKVVVLPENLPTAYGTDSEFKVGDKTFYATNVGNFNKSTDIQFKKSVDAYIANKDDMGKIRSIELTKADSQSFYATNYKLYAGTAEKPGEVEIAASSSSNTNVVFDLSKGNYTYFKVVNATTYTAYVGSIVIKLAE